MTALTSVVTGKTFEGFDVDKYPNSLVPFSVEEQIAIARGMGGRPSCDVIPRPRRRRKKNKPATTAGKKL